MWRRRGSIGSGSTSTPTKSAATESSPGHQTSSITGYPSTPGGNGSLSSSTDPRGDKHDLPLIFTIDVPTPGPLGLDLRARHIERDKPQRGCIVKGFRPLDGGRRGFVEETGRVLVGDILQMIHTTAIDDLPFEQIVNHAIQLQRDASAWPLRLEFKREPISAERESLHSRDSIGARPRRSSFFRSSLIGSSTASTPAHNTATGAQDGNFNEKLAYFRGFFANRLPTGGAAPKKDKPTTMPSSETVNEMYRDLLLKRGVPDDVLDELVRIETLETKWHVVWYAQQHANDDATSTSSSNADAAKLAESLVELKWDNRGLKELEALRMKISVGSTEWLEAFLANFGLDYLTMKLPDPSPFPIEHSKFEKATRVCEVILRILRALTHFSSGVEAITNVPGLVKRIALCFHTDNGELKKYTLQLLGIVCYNSAAGHEAVIHAFDHFKATKGESVRFSCLRDALKSARYSLVFKEDVLSFVNIIVNKAIRLEDRLAIRADFLALDMAAYFDEIRTKSLAVQRTKYPRTTDASPMPSPVLHDQAFAVPLQRKHSVVGRAKSPVLRPLARSFAATSKSAPSSPVDRNDSMTDSPLLQPTRTSLPLERDGIDGSKGGMTIISSTATQLRNQLDNVEKQIDVFERFMEEDRKDTIYERTDLSSVTSVFATLQHNVAHDAELHACLLSVLQQLLFIPADRVIGKEMWSLSERLLKQVGLLAPVEEVRDFALAYDDRKALLRLRDRYTQFLQRCADDDPTFTFDMGPIILIRNREGSSATDDLSDSEDDEVESDVEAQAHPALAKFFKLIHMGMPLPHVELKFQAEAPSGFDVSILSTPTQRVSLASPRAVDKEGERERGPQGTAVKDHPKFMKFFKLMKMGMPLDHIKLKASAEGLDASLLDTPDALVDADGNIVTATATAVVNGTPVKEHVKFAKFFKLMKMGMPLDHIKLKASAEGLDASLLDTPDVLVDDDGHVAVVAVDKAPVGTPVREHALYAKFFKLMKMGMPVEQIKLKASAEGLDATLLDTPDAVVNDDGTRFTPGGGSSSSDKPTGTPVKEHASYAKFFKLMKMGMPVEQIKLKASAEGLNAALLDTPDALVDADGNAVVADEPAGTLVKEHEKFVKFFKLMKMGMPLEQIKLKASAEGLDATLLDTPDALVDADGNKVQAAVQGIAVKDHPKFTKFFKLMKMGMPPAQIKLKASAEGLDATLLDTPDALLDDDGRAIATATKHVKVCAHASYAKFFKLMKMGMPRAQLELKMQAEGLDAALLDTPDALIADGDAAAATTTGPPKPTLPPPPPKPKLRNLYWDIVKTEVTSGTIWEKVAPDATTNDAAAEPAAATPHAALSNLFKPPTTAAAPAASTTPPPTNATAAPILDEYVTKLSTLFVNKLPATKAIDASDAKRAAAATKKHKPTRVALIDTKRANNIGIMLARFRLPYAKIRDAVLLVDKELLSLERVSSLLQFAPEPDELAAVAAYTGDPKLLGDAEQYFLAMLCIPRLPTRLQAIHATWQFDTYVDEQQKLMAVVQSACDELHACAPLQTIFKVVLTLGNALNDGTARGGARGFRLSILLKLNQVKAADNSITLLNYVAQLLRQTDPTILEFDKLLPSVEPASRVTVQVLRAGESAVRKAASVINDELEAHAKLPPQTFPPAADAVEAQAAAPAAPEATPSGDSDATDTSATPATDAAPVSSSITDRFQDEVRPFAARAEDLATRVTTTLDATLTQFDATARFYGEDPTSPDCSGPDAFFSIFYSFAKLLQAADRDNERKRIAEERRVRRDAEAAKRLELLKQKKLKQQLQSQQQENSTLDPTPTQQASAFASLKAGDVDAICETIRAKRVAEKRAERNAHRRRSANGSSVSASGSSSLSSSLGPPPPSVASQSSSNNRLSSSMGPSSSSSASQSSSSVPNAALHRQSSTTTNSSNTVGRVEVA